MRRTGAAFIVAIVASSIGYNANAQETAALTPPEQIINPSPYMRTYGSVQGPYGLDAFCTANPHECAFGSVSAARFNASPSRLSELDQINRQVNRTIAPVSDLDHYGVADYWTLPKDGKGDCEDYALLKRHKLVALGWPANALLMTVVRDENGDGHAVLTARTAQGDFILDNKVDEIRLWTQTPYQYLMRQSSSDARVWLDLNPADNAAPPAIAGVRAK